MGLSPYSTPADGGVLCVLLVNTAISISIMKELVRSILHVVGIHVTLWDDYSSRDPSLDSSSSIDCRGSPSDSYVEEFRSRTPAVRYDSIYSCHGHAQECAVCLTEFVADAEINRLSCGHFFHKACVEKWLKYWNFTCPLCRNYMLPQEADENTCPM